MCFDKSIPKDGVDHEVNVTHIHDWPNKNTSVLKSLTGKSLSCLKQRKKHSNKDNIRNDVITVRSIHSLLNTRKKILYTDILPNYLSKFHKYGSFDFFPSRRPHFAKHPPTIRICPLFPEPPPPLMCGYPL